MRTKRETTCLQLSGNPSDPLPEEELRIRHFLLFHTQSPKLCRGISGDLRLFTLSISPAVDLQSFRLFILHTCDYDRYIQGIYFSMDIWTKNWFSMACCDCHGLKTVWVVLCSKTYLGIKGLGCQETYPEITKKPPTKTFSYKLRLGIAMAKHKPFDCWVQILVLAFCFWGTTPPLANMLSPRASPTPPHTLWQPCPSCVSSFRAVRLLVLNRAKCATTIGKTNAKRHPSMQSRPWHKLQKEPTHTYPICSSKDNKQRNIGEKPSESSSMSQTSQFQGSNVFCSE